MRYSVRMLLTFRRSPFFALAILFPLSFLNAQSSPAAPPPTPAATAPVPANLLYPGEEKHLRNVRQLTSGGQNAEAYFSIDDKMLSFQHQGNGVPCDQIYTMPVDTPDGKLATPRLISSGKGRTTCSYIFPSGDRILYSSTEATNPRVRPSPTTHTATSGRSTTATRSTPRSSDGSDIKSADRRARLQRRVHHQPRRKAHRLHFDAQRRPRHLHHGRRRQRT